jgi:hypothetical protein
MTRRTIPSSQKAAQDLLGQFVKGLRDKFETDTELETSKGVAVEIDGIGTFTILRAHARNQKFIKAYRDKVSPYLESSEAKNKKEDEADKKLEELNREIFVETVIIGLKNVDGQVIPYDDDAKSAVKELLAVTPDLYTLLQNEAMTASNFRKRYEAEEKN